MTERDKRHEDEPRPTPGSPQDAGPEEARTGHDSQVPAGASLDLPLSSPD